ncbi:hypothetical protein OH146_03575 [Salinibacterium sp. SYSU T00001]|uniref:hypothetical protein n=1 Tax=Homoserinimonas sedimenticola TaxID=2986805 RepID=UPI002236A9C9|nr:hypothetical protein [Salinibacterium sedimenticola]MCW4384851.1 hypothetical protein [Salinibacterium sedimenticola]
MAFRRAIYVALRWAPVVLPLWYMLVAGIRGWDDIGLLAVPLVGIALAVGLAVVFFLTWIRRQVRVEGAVSWVDVAIIGLWLALIAASPFAIPAPMLLFVLIVGVAAFWSAIIQWALETRRRVRAVIDDIEANVQSVQQHRTSPMYPARGATPDAPLRGQVIRIEPPAEQGGDR